MKRFYYLLTISAGLLLITGCGKPKTSPSEKPKVVQSMNIQQSSGNGAPDEDAAKKEKAAQ